jgi:eukaryotic-like serine/threonine-protein kinase
VASALDYAHASGVIHPDVKPSNVMVENVTSSGSGKTTRAVLMDFGIARSYAATSKLTHSGMIGTLDYISPEQIQGTSDVGAQADIYSLGVMTYQMLTGRLPFEHNNPGAMVLAHLNQPAPDLLEVARDTPRSAAVAVMQAMAKKPEQRFPSAGEFVAALAA